MRFNYYYANEAEQYSFYRIPKELITGEEFKILSCESKVLYGLMLDRMSLSRKNNWIDNDRVYIYFTIENIMEALNCSKTKAIKLLAELDSEKGIGLIEKKRQGLGKPAKIFVKNFVSKNPSPEPEPSNEEIYTEEPEKSSEMNKCRIEQAVERSKDYSENIQQEAELPKEIFVDNFVSKIPFSDSTKSEEAVREVSKMDFKKSNNQTSRSSEIKPPEVQKMDFKKSNNWTSGGSENGLQEVQKLDPNYTDINKTDINHTEKSNTEQNYIEYQSIHQSHQSIREEPKRCDGLDGEAKKYEQYRGLLWDNLDFECVYENSRDRESIENMIELMLEVICSKKRYVRIGGEDLPIAIVRSRYLKLNHMHIDYVLECMKKTTQAC